MAIRLPMRSLTDRVATRPVHDPLTGRQANRQRGLAVGLDELNRASHDHAAVFQDLIPNRGKIGALSLGIQARLQQFPSKIHELSGGPFPSKRRTGRSPEPDPDARAGGTTGNVARVQLSALLSKPA